MDPSNVERTYEDIERIIKANRIPFTIHEEHTPMGKFKSYSVST